MRVDWDKFKSNVRNRISNYSLADMHAYLIPGIRKYEAIGFSESAEKHGINILNLISIFRWSVIYAHENPRLARSRLNETNFLKIYNGVVNLLDPEIDDAWNFEEIIQYVTRSMMRNQKYLQTDAFRVCLVMAKIFLEHIPKTDADSLASSYGFSNIREFLFAHLHLAGVSYNQRRYRFNLKEYYAHANYAALEKYSDAFFVDFNTFKARLTHEHEANKRNDSLWKEMDDLTYLSGMPGIRNGTEIIYPSMYALGIFTGYSILSRFSSERKPFYSGPFSEGYESFLYAQLSRKNKIISKEPEIKTLLGRQKVADALIENADSAVFVEFKSCKSPRFPFEFECSDDNRKSMKTSLHKGMIQIFESIKRYRQLFPHKRVTGVVVTLHDFFTGKPLQTAKELLTLEESELYSTEIKNYSFSSVIDFLPYTSLPQDEFIEQIFTSNTNENFFQYSNKIWDLDTVSELDPLFKEILAITEENIR
jgi:hypothetical protein